MALDFRLSLSDQFDLCALLIVLSIDAKLCGHIADVNKATSWVNRIAGTNHPLIPLNEETSTSHRARAIEVLSALGEPTSDLTDSHVERIIATAREAQLGVKSTELHRRMAAEIPVETLHFVATGGGR